MTYRCSNCGQDAKKTRANYLFRESGLHNIVLKNIEIIKCSHCGNEDPIIHKMAELMKQIAQALVEKPYALTGAEIRFLRKYLGMSGADFASLLHTDKTVLSRWENSHVDVGSKSDLLIRAIVCNLGSGLKPEAERIVRKFPQINESDQKAVRIEINDSTFAYA
jgi:putative transcriptional regulator